MLGDFLSCFKDLKKENRDFRLLSFLMVFGGDSVALFPRVADFDELPSAIICVCSLL